MAVNCQVFTPKEYVYKLLDFAGYKNNIFGKKVIENSCGNGNILEEICLRYIRDGISQEKSLLEIKHGLEQDVIAYEIDEELVEQCIQRLDLLAVSFGIREVKWNICAKDALKVALQPASFIIANPPYITYSDMLEEDRAYLKNHFISCKFGKFDYYYAFVEQALSCMGEESTLAYILPSSIYKNTSGKKLRELLKPIVTDVYDYESEKKFKDIMTSSTVVVCKSSADLETMVYHNMTTKKDLIISKNTLGTKWYFTNENKTGKRRLGDYCKITNSIATQCNEAFVITDYEEKDKGFWSDGILLEPKLIYSATSPRCIHTKKNHKIIFPYEISETGTICRIPEERFQKEYPGVYKYLKKYKDRLLKRASDKGAKWYEYGRSQAINHMFVPKIIMSSVLTNTVKSVVVDEDVIPYAGIFVYAINDMTIQELNEILNSIDFWNYIKVHSIDSGGNSVRVSVKEIQEYRF